MAFGVELLCADVEEKVGPTITDFKQVLRETKVILSNVQGATENFASMSEAVKYQVERVNAVIEDISVRARVKISKVGEVVSDAVQRMQAPSPIVDENILVP